MTENEKILEGIPTCVLHFGGGVVGTRRRAAMSVQLGPQMSNQELIGVQFRLQFVDQRVSLRQLLDLQLQRHLQVTQHAAASL